MSATVLDPLVLDLVAWVAAAPRPYDEVMEALRTSCPRLTVWEEVVDRGLVAQTRAADRTTMVRATDLGLNLLKARARPPG
jgi:hypothetical protein